MGTDLAGTIVDMAAHLQQRNLEAYSRLLLTFSSNRQKYRPTMTIIFTGADSFRVLASTLELIGVAGDLETAS